MTRPGDTVLILGVEGIVTTISTREPTLGQKCIIIPDGNGGNIAIKPFNTYDQDEGVALPLPCGSAAYVVSEPPNYLPSSWENGVRCTVEQGTPYTDGWECKPTCPINPVFNPCPRGANGGRVNDRDPNFCTNENRIHNYWRDYWYKNQKHHDAVWIVSCRTDCPDPCSNYGYSGTTLPSCRRPAQYLNHTLQSPAYYSYSCNGCPNYNEGKGLVVCRNSPPMFSPGQKPTSCQYHANLDFTGWVVPGAESATASGACVMNKATEGVRSTSDGEIRCKFSQV